MAERVLLVGAAMLLGGLAASCGDYAPSAVVFGARWDLSRPIRVKASAAIPRLDWYLEGLVQAIAEAGGYVGNVPEAQVLRLDETDGGDCEDHRTFEAYTSLNEAIFVCHSYAAQNPYITKGEALQVMRHELGHMLGDRRGHPPCEAQQVMSPFLSCLPCSAYDGSGQCAARELRYTAADLDYICRSGNTRGGACGHSAR